MEVGRSTGAVNNVSLAFALVGGASAWFLHLAGMQALHPLECARGSVSIMVALTVGTAAITIASAVVGFRRRSIDAPDATVRERARFTASTSVVLNLFFLYAIVAETLPLLFDDPCRGFDLPLGIAVSVASAHSGNVPAPATLWRTFSLDPFVLLPLAFVSFAYVRGRSSGRRAMHAKRRARSGLAFGLGMVVLVLSLVSPLDALSEALFSIHMLQHLLLTVVAAPLLAFARVGPSILRALPVRARIAVVRLRSVLRRRAGGLGHPVFLASIHLLALWAWHAPPLYEAALRDPALHALEHACFFGTSLLLWMAIRRALVRDRAESLGIAFVVFVTAIQSGVLGALITLAPMPWYPSHAGGLEGWGRSPLEDQQLAGLLMWIPSSIVYLAAVLALAGRFLEASSGPCEP